MDNYNLEELPMYISSKEWYEETEIDENQKDNQSQAKVLFSVLIGIVIGMIITL